MNTIQVSFHSIAAKHAWMRAQSLSEFDALIIHNGNAYLELDQTLAPYVSVEAWGHFIYRVASV